MSKINSIETIKEFFQDYINLVRWIIFQYKISEGIGALLLVRDYKWL